MKMLSTLLSQIDAGVTALLEDLTFAGRWQGLHRLSWQKIGGRTKLAAGNFDGLLNLLQTSSV